MKIYPRDISGISVLPEYVLVYDIKSCAVYCGDGKSTVQELIEHNNFPPAEKKKDTKPADINKDGKVDEEDLSIVHTEYAKEVKAKKKVASKKKTTAKKASKKKED